jgi:hypothetical protein
MEDGRLSPAKARHIPGRLIRRPEGLVLTTEEDISAAEGPITSLELAGSAVLVGLGIQVPLIQISREDFKLAQPLLGEDVTINKYSLP